MSGLTGGNRSNSGNVNDRKETGDAGEDRALAHLQQHGLTLVRRNYRVAAGPSARAGEVDLIMRDRDREGTLVFVEVRQRARFDHGGAAASVTRTKQARVIYAARHYLQRQGRDWPPCRFDVVAIDGDTLTWLVAAFDAS
jgi:putative endonuclease